MRFFSQLICLNKVLFRPIFYKMPIYALLNEKREQDNARSRSFADSFSISGSFFRAGNDLEDRGLSFDHFLGHDDLANTLFGWQMIHRVQQDLLKYHH